MENKGLPIYTIFVNPKHQRYAEYTVNDNQTHLKDYPDLFLYLIDLLPEKTNEIEKLLGLKRPFIIFLQEKRIQELKFNFYAQMDDAKQKLLHQNINDIMINESKPKTFEDKLKPYLKQDILKNMWKNKNF
jgi:hypothetical protein